MIDGVLPDRLLEVRHLRGPRKLFTSTAIFRSPFSAARNRSAPRSTYISFFPHLTWSGSSVIVHPSLIKAFLTWS